MGNFSDRLAHAWNAFMNKDPTPRYYKDIGPGYYTRPDRIRLTRGNERSIVNSVYNRMALDASSIEFKHVRLDENNDFLEVIEDCLNDCFTLEANMDQTPRAFLQDCCMSMFDEGHVAIVPIETDKDIENDSFKIYSMRTAKVVEWHPKHVKVRIYNELEGRQDEILMPKSSVAIIENPYYSVMNEHNSTVQRLIRKLNILDAIDEQSGAGKLDLIIQLPYAIKSPLRKAQAEERRKDIENQLANNKYGIAYTEATEHVTQLNRPAENNLMTQIEYLTNLLYSQLGITEGIMNGEADENTMNNYYTRTIEPIMSAIASEMKRKFLTKTAITQKQSIEFFRDPFKLVPVSQLAEMSDKLTRNEIMTSNELRQKVGMRPSKDPSADELRNKNLSPAKDEDHIDVDGNVFQEAQPETTDIRRKNQNED